VPGGHYVIGAPLEIEHAITVQSTGGSPAIIDADQSGTAILIAPASGRKTLGLVALTGFEITGSSAQVAIDAADSDDVTLDHDVVTGNSHGGLLTGARTLIAHSTFSDNSADTGGAINAGGGEVTIDSSVIDRNQATHGGGLIAGFGAHVTITGSLFSHDSAQMGGAIEVANTGATVRATNTTFDSGFADQGGMLYTEPHFSEPNGSSTVLVFDTIVGNISVADGVIAGDLSNVQVGDSVVAGNIDTACDGPLTSLGHNLSDDHSCGLMAAGDHQDVDPLLQRVGDNGGPVPTALPTRSSPVLDSAAAPCPPTDARGVVRPQGVACDIGAVELQAGLPTATTGSASGATVTGSVNPGGQPTRVSVQYGPTTAYGHTAQLDDVDGWSSVPISAPLPGVYDGETINYRVVAANASGSSAGSDQTFTVRLPLRIRRLRVHATFPGPHATVTWLASAAGRIELVVTRLRGGRPRAARSVLTHAGRNRMRLPRALLRHAGPGRYRLVARRPQGAALAHTQFSLLNQTRKGHTR
jgi:hypothetical protein